MTRLAVFDEQAKLLEETTDTDAIAGQLNQIGVQFEKWKASAELSEDAGQEEVLVAYESSVNALSEKYGFQSMDVVALKPDHPDKLAFREKFLAEHIHKDFEVRFFVDGKGLFYLHVDDKVFLVMCEKGDLISVPADTKHWFDMGENPFFKCIRFFTTENGWEADFTGNDIAKRFPSFDQFGANP